MDVVLSDLVCVLGSISGSNSGGATGGTIGIGGGGNPGGTVPAGGRGGGRWQENVMRQLRLENQLVGIHSSPTHSQVLNG